MKQTNSQSIRETENLIKKLKSVNTGDPKWRHGQQVCEAIAKSCSKSGHALLGLVIVGHFYGERQHIRGTGAQTHVHLEGTRPQRNTGGVVAHNGVVHFDWCTGLQDGLIPDHTEKRWLLAGCPIWLQ